MYNNSAIENQPFLISVCSFFPQASETTIPKTVLDILLKKIIVLGWVEK